MAPASALGLLSLLLAVPLSLCSNPFIPVTNTCSVQKCHEPTKFRYTPGSSHRYRYTASTASTVLGVSSKSTTLTLECEVIVHVLSHCEWAITLEHVRLRTVAVDKGTYTEKDIDSDGFSSPLESFPLRFGYHDGVVDSVCPESSDPTWSVNIKKGVVSALQNSMDRIDLDYSEVERDVTGDCPVSYKVEATDGATLIISKVRQLNACVGRFAHTSHIQGVGYSIKSPVQNIPIVGSTSSCSHTIFGNRLVRVLCEERHLLQPFSHNSSGAVTVTAQNLTLLRGEDGQASVSQDMVEHRETLLYNHLPAKAAFHNRAKSLADAKALVQDLCENDSEVRVESTTQFSQLIDDLRGMTHKEISAIYRLSPSICRHGQQLIEDALPVVATASSIRLMTDLIVNDQVTSPVANTWLMALNFIPSVDRAMLETAGGLLKVAQPAMKTRARLAVGAVLHQYCRQHDRCDTDHVPLEIMQELVRPLGADCRADSDQDEKDVLLTLRAVGNAGLSPPGVVNTLNECFMSRDNPERIKMAAIEAFRRFSCSVWRDEMRTVFRDMDEDSEVRIAAYLGLMRCPSHQEIGAVRDALSKEQVNQVGSFVWTHLRNLQETSSPYQLEVQGLLADLHLQNKFTTDARKFSKNFEISGFNSEYHVGASLDSNLVYSSKSYIPRSLNSNLTLQLFGESVNLLEVGARVEGLERMVESVFAPGGVLHKAAPEPLFRGRRDATRNEKLEKIKADFDAPGRIGDPHAFFHLKVFGHEVDGVDLRSSDAQHVTNWLTKNGPGEWAKWLSNTESLDISRSVKFLEGTYIVPTGVGLPLNLTASAVAAVNVQMSGNVQLGRLLSSQELDLAFRLRPSGAVTCDMTMMIDGMAVQLGMGMKATVHSSTLVDASLKMEGYKLVDAKVNMPKDRMDLYNFESSMQFIHQEEQNTLTSEITMESDEHEKMAYKSCTGNSHIPGWRSCAQLQYINASTNALSPHFPLTGPTKMALYVEKTDRTMEGYKLMWQITENQFEHNLVVTFDTPRSTIDRQVQLKLKRSKKHGKIGFIFIYPGEKLTGTGETAWEAKRKKLALEVSRRGVEVLAVTAQLVTSQVPYGVTYRPTFIVNFLQNPYVNLRGYVKISNKASEMKREISLSMNSPFIKLDLNSTATNSEEMYKSNIVVRHTLPSSPERELSLLLESRDAGDGDGGRLGHWMVATDWDVADNIRFAWAARWDSKNSRASTMNGFQTAVRPEDFDVRSTFSVGYAFDYMSTEESSKVRGSVHLQYPAVRLDLKLSAEHDNIYRGLINRIVLRYAPGRELRSLLNVTGLPLWRSRQLRGHWRLEVPDYPHPIYLNGTVTQMTSAEPSAPKQYKFLLSGQWLTGGSALIRGHYQRQLNYAVMSDDHQMAFNFTVDRRQLVEASLRLALSQQGVAVVTKVNHDGSQYGLEMQYDVTMVTSDVQRSLRLGLTYPGSGYSVTGTLLLGETFRTTLEISLDGQRDVHLILGGSHTDTLLAGEADLKWDANRDPTQRLMFNFRAEEPSPSARNVTVRVVYPVNTVQLTMDRTMTGGWSRLQYHNHLVLAFGASEPVEVTLSASTALDVPTKRVSVDATATSPFDNWRRNSLKLSHARSPASQQSLLEVAAGGEQLTVSLDGEYQLPRSLSVEGRVTTSLERWPRLEASLQHGRQQDGLASSLVLSTPESRISAELALRDLSGPDPGRRHYRAELNVTTPFQGIHDATYMLDGRHEAGEFVLSGQSRVENIGHNLVLKGRGGERVEGSLVLDQAHPQLNLLTAQLLLDPTERGRAFKTSVTWPNNRAALEGDLHFASWEDFGIGLQCISPLDAIKDAGLMIKHKRSGPYSFQSEARAAWLGDAPLGLSVDFDLQPPTALTLNSELRLPLARWSRLALGLKGVLTPDTRTLSAGIQASLDEHKVAVTADGSLGVLPTDKRYGTVSLTLPGGPVQQLTVAASLLSQEPHIYEMFLSPAWQLRDGSMQQIRLTSVVDLGGRRVGLQRASLRLLTPWTEMLLVDLQNTPGERQLTSRLVGSMGRHNARLEGQLMRTSESAWKFVLTSTSNVPAIPEFQATTTLVYHPTFELVFDARTPREIHLRIASDFTSSDRKTAALELRTPLESIDYLAANLELSGDGQERTVIATVTLPGGQRQIALSGTLRGLDLRITFSTPFEAFESGSLRLSYSVPAAGSSDVVLRLAWDSYTFELTGAAVVGPGGLPRQVTGTLTMNLPIGPRINGNFQLAARPGADRAYDLTLTSSVDRANYELQGEIFTGPQKYGVAIETSSSEQEALLSAQCVVTVNAVPGVIALRMALATPHDAVRNVSLTAQYRNSASEGYTLSYKLLHPNLQLEATSRLFVRQWPLFHLGTGGKLTMGRIAFQRSVRVFHERSSADRSSQLGASWALSSDPDALAGWGQYAVLSEYTLSAGAFDGQLRAGRDVAEDRSAPTDLLLGADVDWQPRAGLARAVFNAHLLERHYTIDTDYSGGGGDRQHTASVRMVRRMSGSEVEVTARAALMNAALRPLTASLNLTLPVDGYKAVNTAWKLNRLPQAVEASTLVEIDPKSSFYQRTSHQLQVGYDGATQQGGANGDFSYLHRDLDDDLDLTKVNGKVTLINSRDQIGVDASGELNDGLYTVEAIQFTLPLGKGGKLNITSSFEALQDFLATYEFKRDASSPAAGWVTKFGTTFNQNQLIDGTYQFMRGGPGSQRHVLDLQNPLHPFDADLTYTGTSAQQRVDFTVTSQSSEGGSVTGWAQQVQTAGGRTLEANVTLPWRQLAVRHSTQRSGPVYKRAARLTLSPEAFVGYQLTVTGGTEHRQEEGGSVRLQLDLPSRSMAGSAEAGRTMSRRNNVFSSGRAKLAFQWDAERQPERQVSAVFKVSDLSTESNLHYNLTATVDIAGKPATLETSVQRSQSAPVQLDAAFMYSSDPDSHLTMSYGVLDQNRGSKRVLKSTLFVSHPVSRLSVTGKGNLEVSRGTWKVSGSYTYLDIEDNRLQSTVLLEFDRKLGQFEGQVTLPSMIYELKSSSGLKEYRVTGAAIPTEFGSPQTLLATLDRSRPLVKLEVLYDPDQAKRLYMTGGMVNNRTVRMEAYRQAGQYRVDDVVFFLRLNHSHLLTSQARWRTELAHELTEWASLSAASTRDALLDVTAAEWDVKTGAMQSSLEDMFGPEIDMLVDEFTTEQSGKVLGDIEDVRYAVMQSYENNEFYMQTILSYIYGEEDSLVNSLLNQLDSWTEQLREDMGVINEAVYEHLNQIIEYLRSLVSSADGGDRTVADTMKEVLTEMAEAYNQWAKAAYARTRLRLRQVYATVTGYVRHRLMQLAQQYQPQLLMLHHHFETHVVQVVRDTVNWFYGEFTQSELYSAVQWLEVTIDQIYRDISERDMVTNVFDYTKKMARWLYTKFGLVDVLGEPGLWLNNLWENPPSPLDKLKPYIMVAHQKLSSVLADLTVIMQHVFGKIYRDGDKFWTQTAIQGAQRYFEGKSIMQMNPERGYISFIQILPMPWYGLNQSPIWKDLPELQQIGYLRSFTESSESERSIHDFVYDYWPGSSNPTDWLPPFKGHAVLSGSSTLVTFDGQLYTFRGDCTYLLAADLLHDRFSVEATFKRRGPISKIITVTAGEHTIQLGGRDGFRITVDSKPAEAPLQVGELRAVRSGDVITVTLPGWMELKCNQRSNVCTLEVSPWMFGRTGGLFGTLDNEPYTDLQTPDHLSASGPLFAAGWALKSCRQPAHVVLPGRDSQQGALSLRTGGKRTDGFCRGLLASPQAEYRVCHRRVDPAPFLAACEAQQDERRCVAVRAYVEACRQLDLPLRLPNKCVQCEIAGQTVFEGKAVPVRMNQPATEVVFIVEAKQCNANATHRRSLAYVVRSLHNSLRRDGFATPRFAVLVFGGSGVQNEPRAITVDGHIFNAAKKVPQAFNQIKPGSGSRDVFGALRRASQLPFTPGVSRTFILLPCSACEASQMSIDYTTLANAFSEQQITLHVLLDGDLAVSKQRNRLLGIDSEKAYTMKDAKKLVGDAALLKHVTPPKAQLSLCEPLATKQTKGSIFSSSKLSPPKSRAMGRLRKRFLTVFGRRVALTARPEPCQTCECATDVEGTVQPLCMPCSAGLMLPTDPEDDIFFEDA